MHIPAASRRIGLLHGAHLQGATHVCVQRHEVAPAPRELLTRLFVLGAVARTSFYALVQPVEDLVDLGSGTV